MADFLSLIESKATENQAFPPSLNKYMDIIKMFDPSIDEVIIVVDGDTVKKSKFSYTIGVKDVIKSTAKSRETIFDKIKTFNESQDSNYDITRLAMSESIRKCIRPNSYTILNVDSEESEFYSYKDKKMITYHKFYDRNIRKT